MKMIKTRLRNRLGEQNLAHLMRIAIEIPEKLPDDIVESGVDIWNRKTRRIAVLEKKTFKNVKKISGCPKMYGNKKTSAMSWMNVAKSYGDLFYTPKSLPYF